ncbi:MAG: hypothetical protein PHT62_11085 [Desulfotomaculaceae bacterium]|nr:hypothetical protein [Desulfotomaculaceae bacterium]
MQAIYYNQTGTYIQQKAELIPRLQLQEREILQTGITLKKQPNMVQAEFERLSDLLFNWAAGLIIEYKIE